MSSHTSAEDLAWLTRRAAARGIAGPDHTETNPTTHTPGMELGSMCRAYEQHTEAIAKYKDAGDAFADIEDDMAYDPARDYDPARAINEALSLIMEGHRQARKGVAVAISAYTDANPDHPNTQTIAGDTYDLTQTIADARAEARQVTKDRIAWEHATAHCK